MLSHKNINIDAILTSGVSSDVDTFNELETEYSSKMNVPNYAMHMMAE